MRVWTLKDNSISVSNFARESHQESKTYPTNATRVIEEQVSEQGKNIIYELHAERINPNPNVAEDDLGYNQTFFSINIANRETKTLYVLHFESATEIWDQEWETGQIMMETLLEFLQR